MERFLKARHWQIFLLTFAIPVFLYILMLITIVSTLINQRNHLDDGPPQSMFTVMMIFLPVIIIIGAGSLFAWQWSIGSGLREKLPVGVKMRHNLFRIFMIVPVVYYILGIAMMFYGFSTISEIAHAPHAPMEGPGPGFFYSLVIFIPLHLFSIFCLFYNMIFVAKTIKSIELQREATFGEYALEFVLVWFFPIGIWFLQPRINKIAQTGQTVF